MAKRLSSIFGITKENHAHGSGADSPTSDMAPVSPVSAGKLHKHRDASRSELTLSNGVPPLEPPPTFRETAGGISSRPTSRPSSRDGRPRSVGPDYPSSRESSRSRPQTPVFLGPNNDASSPSKLAKKRSWMPGRSDRQRFDEGDGHARAWIAGLKEHIPYELGPLLRGEPVRELWDEEHGDVLVHIYPQASGRGPSFRVSSELFADSRTLAYLHDARVNTGLQTLALDDFGPALDINQGGHTRDPSVPKIIPPSAQLKTIYLPLELEGNLSDPTAPPSGDDLELIVLYRNFFAFLGGGALVSTPRQATLFSVFLGISSILRRLQYSNKDGSTWGDVAETSFARYCDELRLGDVRVSREKTIEAIVLGEHMRSWQLYNEGFVHAAGRLVDIKHIHSPKYAKITPITINRLERASLDVENRLGTLRGKLEDFEFPAMFSGIANSKVAEEAKAVRFKAWRLAFIDMRKFTLAQYRRRYGSWPPKASSKKNKFEESGLNRLLVREMYQDFCDLYDMLANKKDVTTRTVDMQPMSEETASNSSSETLAHAIRVVESEYDRATPPVMPPIPFDTPSLPTLDSSFKGGEALIVGGSAAGGNRKLKANELNELLLGSYNREAIRPTPWIQEFMAYERKLGAGATLDQLVDYRCGQWLFLYAVLQALPMTVVDARGVQFVEGVEYFLFAAPRGGKPWMREDTTVSRAWYNVTSGGQVVSLPADVLDHQPEGVYRRSHCWLIANQWLQESGKIPPASNIVKERYQGTPSRGSPNSYGPAMISSPQHSPYQSPALKPVISHEQPPSAVPKSGSHTSLQVALEKVAAPTKSLRPASTYNPSITFDSILGGEPQPKGKKKR